MAWIESHQELKRHPKTKRFAKSMNISIPTAIGHLHCLWWWCLDYAENGDLSGFEREEIAEAAMYEGDGPEYFVLSLVNAGFIDQDEDDHSLSLHDWEDYAGRLIHQREIQRAKRDADAERQRRHRSKKNTDFPAGARAREEKEPSASLSQTENTHGPVDDATSEDVTRDGHSVSRNVTGLPYPTVPNQTLPDQTLSLSKKDSSARPDKSGTPGDNWDMPDWWEPMIELDGYVNLRYNKTVNTIEAVSRESDVSPRDVIKGFAEFYRVWKVFYNWSNPTATINRLTVLMKTIARVKSGEKVGSPDNASGQRYPGLQTNRRY